MTHDETEKLFQELEKKDEQAKENIIQILKDNNFSIAHSETIFKSVIYYLQNTPLNYL